MKYCPLCRAELVTQVHEQKTSLGCSSQECEYVFWDNPVPVVLGLVRYQGKFVITNNADWPDWKYSLVSGFVDARESSADAIKREVHEELNLKAGVTEIITVNLFERLNQLMIAYYVEAQGNLVLNNENRAYKLLNDDELAHWKFGLGATPVIQKWFSEK